MSQSVSGGILGKLTDLLQSTAYRLANTAGLAQSIKHNLGSAAPTMSDGWESRKSKGALQRLLEMGAPLQRHELGDIGVAAKALLEIFRPLPNPNRLDNLDRRITPLIIPIYGLIQRYFRASVTGLEKMPKGKALIVGNHNSGITFLEPVILGREWVFRNDGDDDFFFLVHDAMVSIPVLGNVLMKSGAVRASREAAGRIFSADRKLVTFPGGNLEAFRPWKERHQIKFHGHKGFARTAIQHGAPIVPLLCLGGHDTFFVVWQGERLARLTGVKKYLLSPSFPIFLGLPWGIGIGPIFHFPLPVKMHIELGDPIPTDHIPPGQANDPLVLQELYDTVTGRLQDMMDRKVAEQRR